MYGQQDTAVATRYRDYQNDSAVLDASPMNRKCRVLVVDDDEIVRARLALLLEDSGYAVDAAASGDEALRMLNRRPSNILVTDWQMPDMDGVTLCRRLRQSDLPEYVYVLMLTIRNSKQDILDGFAAGVDEYVVKGAPLDEVLARVEVGRRIARLQHPSFAAGPESKISGSAVLHCDIGEIRQIGERFGHEIGDQLVREFVARVEACTRKKNDRLTRISDEQFLVVLPGTTASGAERVAQKLRQTFAIRPVTTSVGSFSLTAIVGVTAQNARRAQ